jgi:hypothetical protein
LLEPAFLTYFVTVFLIVWEYLGFRTEPTREGVIRRLKATQF